MFQTIELDLIDEKIHYTEIMNLKVYYIPKKGFAKSYAMLTSDFGSKDVEFSVDGGRTFKRYPEGIAHFLEHKVFEMPGGENIFNKFTELGASVNAFTNNRQTSYYFSTTDNFYENLELLVKMVMTPHLTEENVEKEKGIIAEEIAMYDDNPAFRGYLEAMKALYHNHPVREDIAGTKESIYSLTPRDLQECYDAFYDPSNMVLVVVGDLDEERVRTVVQDNLSDRKVVTVTKKAWTEPYGSRIMESTLSMALQVPNYILAWKVPPGQNDLMKDTIAGSLMAKLVFGKSSTFYEEHLADGIINDSFSAEFNLEEDHGEMFIGGESKNPEKDRDAILEYIGRVNQDPEFFSKRTSEIELLKKSMTGQFMNIFNSVDSIGITATGNILRGKNLHEYILTLRSITQGDVENMFKRVFGVENRAFIVIK